MDKNEDKREQDSIIISDDDNKSFYAPDEYPYNLLSSIFYGDLEQDYPSDIKGTIEYVLTEMLTPRECEVIHLRYQQKLTLKEIADRFGLTSERIRQILARATARLRHPNRRKFILNGMAFLGEAFYLEKKSQMQLERIDVRLDRIETQLSQCSDEQKKEIAANRRELIKIEDLDLSVRSYNCLRRANLNTVGDILALQDADSLQNIRNLGRRSYEEILNKLYSMGFDVEHLRTY